MRYRAKVTFADLQDHKRLYHEGDKFPRDGFMVSKERLSQLASSDNQMGYPLIEAVEDEPSATAEGFEDEGNRTKEKVRKRKVKADA